MRLNQLKKKSYMPLFGVSFLLVLTGCNASFSDPFAEPPIGQKFFVPPDPDNKLPMNLHSETVVTKATLIKLKRSDELGSSRSSFSAIGHNAPLDFKSITVVRKDGFKDVYDRERIRKINNTSECQGIKSDIKELMMSYPDLHLVCGHDFTSRLRTALTVIMTTTDGKEHEFTSWGSHFSDGERYRVVVQSFSL